ncbi:hypothetical protein BV20DRAFT_409397 [Pilatotrama ljubarskyi]|nr:hypothetical protein BV20DRAFT_409397 [Pilatotrama ljubarskyi]
MSNVANILTFLTPHIGDSSRGLATTLSNALATTLVSRMFLNLRDPDLRADGRVVAHSGQWSVRDGEPGRGGAAEYVSAIEFRRLTRDNLADVESFSLDVTPENGIEPGRVGLAI